VRPLQFLFQIPVAFVLLGCFLISSMGLIFTHWHGHGTDWHQAQWGLAVALGLSGTLLHELDIARRRSALAAGNKVSVSVCTGSGRCFMRKCMMPGG
jgi:uncharacterized membrane protein YvlD (DUF360 family)